MATGDQDKPDQSAEADALALIVGRLNHSAKSDGMWEDSREALKTLGYTDKQIRAAMARYESL